MVRVFDKKSYDFLGSVDRGASAASHLVVASQEGPSRQPNRAAQARS